MNFLRDEMHIWLTKCILTSVRYFWDCRGKQRVFADTLNRSVVDIR